MWGIESPAFPRNDRQNGSASHCGTDGEFSRLRRVHPSRAGATGTIATLVLDLATIIGGVLGMAVVIVSILIGGSLTAFIDYPSLAIVVGGTICTAMVAETMENCINGAKVAAKAVFKRTANVEETIATIVKLATVARRDGLIALENEKIEGDFLTRAVRLAVDGMERDTLRTALQGELISMKQRHKRGYKLFRFLAATAPAMGMIGTLIGLVQMLQTLDNPASIGPAMAIALLTTLYGGLIAFMICGPLAEKLERRSEEEGTNMALIIEGIESIVKGENPRMIQEKLEGFLAPKARSSSKKE